MSPTDSVVLLGEPDPATRNRYQRALRAAFDVIVAPDADTVRHMLRTRPVAALVLEPAIFAPPSWAQLGAISHMCAARGIPLVICRTRDQRRRGIALSATTYLVTPTLPATLLDTLRQVIGSRRSCAWMPAIRPYWPS